MPRGRKVLIFVVHEHHAKNLHHDFRLEIGGVLRSWAVPKGMPQESGIRRLAILTEDHHIDYADFEGTIPEGEYGAGIVKIWDKGTYIPEKIMDTELVVTLRGEKLRGTYVLIRLKDGKNWLIFKSRKKA